MMGESVPLPGWPRYLSREEAARYVGVSMSTFDDEVEAGQWPQPRRRGGKGTRLTWDRTRLDAFADAFDAPTRMTAPHVCLPDTPAAGDAAPDISANPILAAAEAAALRGVSNAQTQHRAKHSNAKAA